MALLLIPNVGAAQPQEQPEWTERLNAYLRDPVSNRRQILDLGRTQLEELPNIALVPISDAFFRSGDTKTATMLLQRAVGNNVGEPWQSVAQLGLGMIAVKTGDMRLAQQHFELATQADASAGNLVGSAALLALGQAAAANGDAERAMEAFDSLLRSGALEPQLRQAAEIARASALYHGRNYLAAAEAFEAIASRTPDSLLASDARYAAARSRMRLGDHSGAKTGLRDTLQLCPEEEPGKATDRQRHSARMRELDPRAALKTWLSNYKNLPFSSPAVDAGGIYTLGGCWMARQTLKRYEAEANSEPLTIVGLGRNDSTDLSIEAGRDRRPSALPAERSSHSAKAPSNDFDLDSPWVWSAMFFAVGSLLLLALKRPSRRGPVARRRS